MAVLNYPILFVYGMGFHDNPYISYWGRIPSVFYRERTSKILSRVYYAKDF